MMRKIHHHLAITATLCAAGMAASAQDLTTAGSGATKAERYYRPIPISTPIDLKDPDLVAKLYRERLDLKLDEIQTDLLESGESPDLAPTFAKEFRQSPAYGYRKESVNTLGNHDPADELWGFESPPPGSTWPIHARRARIAWEGSVATVTLTLFCADEQDRCAHWFSSAAGVPGKHTAKRFDATSLFETTSRFDLSKSCREGETQMPRPLYGNYERGPGEDGISLTATLIDRCRKARGVWMLKSSGDLNFDKVIVRTLSNWRISPDRYKPADAASPAIFGKIPVVTLP